jgi:cytochrome c biogenesis protein CcdA
VVAGVLVVAVYAALLLAVIATARPLHERAAAVVAGVLVVAVYAALLLAVIATARPRHHRAAARPKVWLDSSDHRDGRS